jgi:hypothetical protein
MYEHLSNLFYKTFHYKKDLRLLKQKIKDSRIRTFKLMYGEIRIIYEFKTMNMYYILPNKCIPIIVADRVYDINLFQVFLPYLLLELK